MRDGRVVEVGAEGRHDACVVPQVVPMVESMVVLEIPLAVLESVTFALAQNGHLLGSCWVAGMTRVRCRGRRQWWTTWWRWCWLTTSRCSRIAHCASSSHGMVLLAWTPMFFGSARERDFRASPEWAFSGLLLPRSNNSCWLCACVQVLCPRKRISVSQVMACAVKMERGVVFQITQSAPI